MRLRGANSIWNPNVMLKWITILGFAFHAKFTTRTYGILWQLYNLMSTYNQYHENRYSKETLTGKTWQAFCCSIALPSARFSWVLASSPKTSRETGRCFHTCHPFQSELSHRKMTIMHLPNKYETHYQLNVYLYISLYMSAYIHRLCVRHILHYQFVSLQFVCHLKLKT